MCDTYPSVLYLPTAASNPVLIGSARFRSRGRLPALSFLYKKTKVFTFLEMALLLSWMFYNKEFHRNVGVYSAQR